MRSLPLHLPWLWADEPMTQADRAFVKKTEKTPRREIELALTRAKSVR